MGANANRPNNFSSRAGKATLAAVRPAQVAIRQSKSHFFKISPAQPSGETLIGPHAVVRAGFDRNGDFKQVTGANEFLTAFPAIENSRSW
jgi:hypothetical protein